jgi:hypothetical protein
MMGLKVEPAIDINLQEGLFVVQLEMHSDNEIAASASGAYLLVWLNYDDDFLKLDILVAWRGTTYFVCGFCCYLVLIIAVVTNYTATCIFHVALVSLQLQRMLSLEAWYGLYYYLLTRIQMKHVVDAKGVLPGWHAVRANSETVSAKTMGILYFAFLPAIVHSEHIAGAWDSDADRKTNIAPTFRLCRPMLRELLADSRRLWDPGGVPRQSAWGQAEI